MRHWRAGGKFLFKYFEWFSWFFLILTLVTLYFMGLGIYNYAAYGNCNGPNSNEFCIFDPLGTVKPAAPDATHAACSVPQIAGIPDTLKAPIIDRSALVPGSYKGSLNASVIVVEFGCYECQYTRQAEPTVKRLTEEYGDSIIYIYQDFPLTQTHANALSAAEAAHCALDQGKYWDYRDYLFANQPKQSPEDLVSYAGDLNMDLSRFQGCMVSQMHKAAVDASYQLGISSGVTVTPTFFIGTNQTIVGAKDLGTFEAAINKELGRKTMWEYLAFWK